MTVDLPDWAFGVGVIPRHALRPTQSPYFAVITPIVEANSHARFYVEDGYAKEKPWVPIGKRFSIWYVLCTTLPNAASALVIEVESQDNPGSYTALAGAKGYERIEFPGGVLFDFEANTRPIYHIYNFGNMNRQFVITIFGIEESV